jgi:hypothetical protein
MAADREERECMDCGHVGSDVSMTTTPDRRDFKMFPRCEECHEKRIRSARRTMNRYPEAFTGPCPLDNPEW